MESDTASSTLALFGASGGTGRVVAASAAARGLPIRALARNRSVVGDLERETLLLRGSLLDPAAVGRTLDGATAVICVFGPRPPYTDIFCADATRLIVQGMRTRAIQRLVVQTGAMLGDYPANRTLPFRWMTALFRRRNPAGEKDRTEQEAVVRASGLAWTIVKPPRLTGGGRSPRFRASPDLRVGMRSSVSRADLAAFLLQQLAASGFVGEAVFVSS